MNYYTDYFSLERNKATALKHSGILLEAPAVTMMYIETGCVLTFWNDIESPERLYLCWLSPSICDPSAEYRIKSNEVLEKPRCLKSQSLSNTKKAKFSTVFMKYSTCHHQNTVNMRQPFVLLCICCIMCDHQHQHVYCTVSKNRKPFCFIGNGLKVSREFRYLRL